jgi:hypothetical protein
VRHDRVSRLVAGFTTLVVVVGIILQLHATATSTGGFFSSKADRIANVFCFFTVLSNLLLAATNGVLAVDPNRRSPVFSAFRLAGVLSMIVTGVVFHLALRGLHDLHGTAAAADFLLHTVSPVMAVVSWLAVGPHGVVTRSVIGMTLIYPVGWLIVTLIRGAIVGFYPYPFLDATTHGYLRVTVNCLLVAVLFLALAIGAAALDRALAPTGTSSAPGGR